MNLGEFLQVEREFAGVEAHVYAVLRGDDKASGDFGRVLHIHDAAALATAVFGRIADAEGIPDLAIRSTKRVVELPIDGSEEGCFLVCESQRLLRNRVNRE